MKKVLLGLSLLLASISYGQLVPVVDASFTPTIDTSIHSTLACKVNSIVSTLDKDTITRVSITTLYDNNVSDSINGVANVQINLLDAKLKAVKSYAFTFQGINHYYWYYIGNEYAFKVAATYLKNNPDVSLTLTFK